MSLWQGTETSCKEQWSLSGQTPLQMRTATYNDEAAPGAEAIMSWEPDHPLQWGQQWHLLQNPSGNPGTEIMVNQSTPVTGTIWLCISSCPVSSSFVHLNLQLMSVPWRWLKISWVLTLSPPMVCPKPCNKPPFPAFTRPHYWRLGAGGWMWHVESWEFGLWAQNSCFLRTLESVSIRLTWWHLGWLVSGSSLAWKLEKVGTTLAMGKQCPSFLSVTLTEERKCT
jgi:hypothetical protein